VSMDSWNRLNLNHSLLLLHILMVWLEKQKAAAEALKSILIRKLNFASKFEYGPVQRTIIDLAIKKFKAIRNV